MTEQLQVFENEEFGQVRVLETEGQPWFVGKDVTKNLGYRNHNDAMIKHVDAEDKGGRELRYPWRKTETRRHQRVGLVQPDPFE